MLKDRHAWSKLKKKITENNRLIGDLDIGVSTQNFKISIINVFKKTEEKNEKGELKTQRISPKKWNLWKELNRIHSRTEK